MKTLPPKARYFWPLLLILFVTDCSTKDLAVEHLTDAASPHSIIDSFVRLTLAHNPGTAFGFDIRPYVGDWARPLLIVCMTLMLAALFRIYSTVPPRARLAAAALGLAAGGAIGNIFDRIRFRAGVVDFIDVGLGSHRFWVFNVADAGITVGALLLAFTLLRAEFEASASRPAV
jgi:signal peptidase II